MKKVLIILLFLTIYCQASFSENGNSFYRNSTIINKSLLIPVQEQFYSNTKVKKQAFIEQASFLSKINSSSSDEYNLFSFGLGYSQGIFNPDDVNKYIEDYLSYRNQSIEPGVSDMGINIAGYLSFNFRLADNFEIIGNLEAAICPKFISVEYITFSGDNTNDFETFYFSRFSIGAISNYIIPMGSGKHSIFFGAGPFFHRMKFEKYSGSKLAIRGNAGISLSFWKINLRPVISLDIVKAEDNQYNDNFELNYTSFNIGVYVLLAL
ncbi:MAG: hypothetical protein KAT68_07815 [Bacteroidales bacterium]|nr:hypothetical protein [Bacteroidales bacterium]